MVLYGASGHAKVIIDILIKNDIKITAIIDDNTAINNILNFSVNRKNEVTINENVIISIGNNRIRKKISENLDKQNFGNATHPNAIIANTATIDKGTVIMANAVVNADAKIGKHCIINTNAIVEHDCIIGDFAHISPSATLCGNVIVGEGTHIGAGATIIPNIKIGKWCVIGAGSVVIKDIPDHTKVVGNPAKIIK